MRAPGRSLRSLEDHLADASLLALMTPSLAALARRGALINYRKGQDAIVEGDHGDTMLVILAGRMRAYSTDATGERQIIFGEYERGEYLGEMSLDGGPRSASVMAVESSVCSLVTRATLDTYLHDDPSFAFELLAKVIRRARHATLTARQLALNSVYGRLKQFLESRARLLPDGRMFVPGRHTQRDIAFHVGCTREMVTRVLRDLKGSYLESSDEGIVILRSLPAKW